MKKLRIWLLAATGVAAITAALASGASSLPLGTAAPAAGEPAGQTMLHADYDGRGEGHGWGWFRFGHGDRRVGEHERDHRGDGYAENDDDDDWGHGRGAQNAPARAGEVAPPDNGLILKGSKPKVQVN